ncbi:penicillin-binding transpeptidase domain-containing protein [Lactobacillus corticis]|uniref:Penicillin-binding protein 2B n=1 Tax=Lactobacillus corticis TaxID=2201249 RepID=A0A916QIN3_9LACO|nr:penicillin-binding transpeptidase domain-containing protein [Lactobacillus corticis]GFZ27729.1 penicillin-binding protein 2B [Lactobacillus corticis]
MKKQSNSTKNTAKAHSYRFTVGRILQIIVALVFLVFIGRFIYLGLSKTVNGVDLSKRTKSLYSTSETLTASRGTIYDRSGSVVAEDTNLYTIYAILDKSSINYKNKPEYVVDKEKTAEKLSTVLSLSKKQILKYLSKKNVYQVQFGTAGSNLTLDQKKKIQKMNLPGIKFTETPSRLYPNGVFASNLVGLTSTQSDKKTGDQSLVGVMGIEAYFNNELTGKDGYKITSASSTSSKNNVYKPAQNGNNVYLTLDSQLQSFLETQMSAIKSKYQPKKLTAVVEDMKTGQILAASQRPTFNAQTRKGLSNSYRDVLTQDSYEPGSVFKILTLSAAIETGNYQPNSYYRSGSLTLGGSTIHDWNNSGWGSIPFWQAFPRSSNVGFALLERKIGAKKWKEYLKKYHIGQKSGITLPGEQAGSISFSGSLDQAVTSFGQGVNVNVWQMMQAFSTLGNNGQMVKPQLVKKITDADGKTVKSYQVQKVGSQIYSAATRKTIVQEMKRVMNANYGTGHAYKISGLDIGVKTGTAQIASKNGGYLSGDKNYIFSVVGIYPTKNPRYCVYITMQQPKYLGKGAEVILSSIFKPLMKRVALYAQNQSSDVKVVKVPSLTGKTISKAKAEASASGIELEVLGSGKKVIAQGLSSGETLIKGNKLLVNTGGTLTMPDMTGWTSNYLEEFTKLTGIKISQSGSGTVSSQSLKAGSSLKSAKTIKIKLKE